MLTIQNTVLPIVLLIIVITVMITTVKFPLHPIPSRSTMADDPLVEQDEYDTHNYSLPGVYFSIKASESYSYSRLTPSALTWFRKVPPKNVFIVTDNKDNLTETIARLGGCDLFPEEYTDRTPSSTSTMTSFTVAIESTNDTQFGLLCKNGKEFSIYYEQVEAGNNFNWYCHLDDDVYINTGELEKVLLSRDPNEAHYIGRISDKHFNVTQTALDYYSNKIKKKIFSFACGGVYCISKKLMSEIEIYVRGNNLTKTNEFVGQKGDDATVGFVIESLHGYKLFNLGSKIQLQYWLHETGNFKEKVAVSYVLTRRHNKLFGTNIHLPNPVFSFNDDNTRFLSYHCLLYPTESWCRSRTVPKLESI